MFTKKVVVAPIAPEIIVPYTPYVDEVEYGPVFRKIDAMVEDNEEDAKYMKVRVSFTMFAWISACLGIFLVFYGGAYSIAFQSVPRRFWLLCCGYVLCVPIVLWCIFMFCASKEERKRRRTIFAKREVRLGVYVEHPELLKFEAKQRMKERIEAEIKQKEEEERRLKEMIRQNPLKYPERNAITRKK